MPARTIGILGHGFVGTATARALLQQGRESGDGLALTICHRGRLPDAAASSDLAGVNWVAVNLGTEDVLAAVGHCETVLVTFPLKSSAAAEDNAAFSDRLFNEMMRLRQKGVSLCLLSSTSGYSDFEGTITEDSAWMSDDSRFGIEERLRVEAEATVIPLVGLFGGSRDPRQWILKGLIPDLNRSVNLVRHDDAGVCVAKVLTRPPPGQRINVGPGFCQRWIDIARACGIAVNASDDNAQAAAQAAATPIRLVSNARLLGRHPELRHYSFATVASTYGAAKSASTDAVVR